MREILSEFAQVGIIRLSAVGDIVLCAAMVDALAKTRPLWRISWFTAAWVTDVFKFPDNVKIICTKKPKKISDYWHFRQQQKKLSGFDILLALQASLRINFMIGLIPSKYTLGFDHVRGREGHAFFIDQQIPYQDNHLLDGFLQFLTALDLPLSQYQSQPPSQSRTQTLCWPIQINQNIQEWADRQLANTTRWIAINLRASKTERNWCIDHFLQLIIELLNHHQNLAIVLTGGNTPDEQQAAQQLLLGLNKQGLAHRLLNQVGRTTLPQLIALLKRCQCLIAPDTGPVHLARAINIPVIGLYAVARSTLTGPYRALEHCVDVYEKAVQIYGKKDPQKVPWHYRVHDKRAMDLITVQAVKNKVDLVIANQL